MEVSHDRGHIFSHRRCVSITNTANGASNEEGTVRVWLVERTYSDDEQNMIILIYATPDGGRYFRKERALTSANDIRKTMAAVEASPHNLGTVEDTER